MYKILLLSLSLIPTCCAAQTHLLIPNKFYIRENAIGITRHYDLESKEQKFAYLERHSTDHKTYTLYDTQQDTLTKIYSHVLSQTTYFEIYDAEQKKIGMVEEYFYASYPSFNIYLGDNKFPTASAKMNFWGTTFTLKDVLTHQEIAELSRPYFRLQNEWTVFIKEPVLLDKRRIDAKLLLSVVSIQCDEENWQPMKLKHPNAPSEAQIAQTIKDLDEEFFSHIATDDDDDGLFCKQYQSYCHAKMNAPEVDETHKNIIRFLLKTKHQIRP